MAGRAIRFHTAVCLIGPGGHLQSATDTTTVRFRELSIEEIERYVDREPAFDCAGSFKAEALGIALFDAIDCSDPTALVGLPLIATARLLRDAGFPLPDLPALLDRQRLLAPRSTLPSRPCRAQAEPMPSRRNRCAIDAGAIATCGCCGSLEIFQYARCHSPSVFRFRHDPAIEGVSNPPRRRPALNAQPCTWNDLPTRAPLTGVSNPCHRGGAFAAWPHPARARTAESAGVRDRCSGRRAGNCRVARTDRDSAATGACIRRRSRRPPAAREYRRVARGSARAGPTAIAAARGRACG